MWEDECVCKVGNEEEEEEGKKEEEEDEEEDKEWKYLMKFKQQSTQCELIFCVYHSEDKVKKRTGTVYHCIFVIANLLYYTICSFFSRHL